MKGRFRETDSEFEELGGKIVEHASGGLTPLIPSIGQDRNIHETLSRKWQKRKNTNMAETTSKRGRTASALTQAKKDSKEARNILKAMVDSYISEPTEYKAEAIKDQLENVEVSENVLRSEAKKKEGDLFAKYRKVEEEEASDETEEEEEDEEEEEETPEPVKPIKPATPTPGKGGMVTAKTQQQAGKKK